MDRHLRKLDQELAKFKMELEADNAGITEILERRESIKERQRRLCSLQLSIVILSPVSVLPFPLFRIFRDGQSVAANQ